MNDEEVNITYFKKVIKEFVKERQWTRYHTPQNLIQALGIEVSELSELFLFKELNVESIFKDPKLYEDISDEIADIFIYLISLINVLDIDLTSSFNVKMEKNRKKYSIEQFHKGNYHKK